MRNILLILLSFYSLITKEQVLIGSNLVNNPSFEEYDTCPTNTMQLNRALYWWGFSTEYYNSCAISTSDVSVPLNGFGFQNAHTGVAYAGCGIYTNYYYYKEAIKTKLKDSLIASKRYCSNFYISLAEYTFWQTAYSVYLDSVGTLFTENMVQDTSYDPILCIGTYIQKSISYIDTVSWFKISNSFIANGGEHYLTIGNFDIALDYTSNFQTYVYIDDVAVCECSFQFNLGKDTTICNGETLILNPNITNATYTWQDGNHDSTFTVTQAGTYWVKAYFAEYGITTYDTINIMYKPAPPTPIVTLITGDSLYSSANNNNQWYCNDTIITGATNQTYLPTTTGYYYVIVTDSNGCSAQSLPYTYTGIEELIKNNGIYVYPNPASDRLNLQFRDAIEGGYVIDVYNYLGKKVISEKVSQTEAEHQINTTSLNNGIYIYNITTTTNIYKGKFTIIK